MTIKLNLDQFIHACRIVNNTQHCGEQLTSDQRRDILQRHTLLAADQVERVVAAIDMIDPPGGAA